MYPTITMSPPVSWNVAWLSNGFERLMKRFVEAGTRRALLRLDNVMLSDIGLTRSEIETGELAALRARRTR
ncbi:MAG TPA: DUF1127 domain-containing protein [Aestuariivirgaceae bacterium]|nr:DUF1127 domain-containing protein [Aestuariivirgaceae bacterium]